MSIEVSKKKVRLTLIEGLLGTKAANPELLEDYIASKRPEGVSEDELETLPTVDEEVQKGSTLFSRDDDGTPFIFDYQVKGFFKDAQGCLNRVPEHKLPAHKKVIDGLVFPGPRRIRLELPEGVELKWCERPLRADTPQGERVSIARSEEAPAGTTLTFEISVLDPKLWDTVESWLNYGELRGLGQWRNSGKGRFTWEYVK